MELVTTNNNTSFVDKMLSNVESIEQVKEIGLAIIKSGFCPDHFKKDGGDPVGLMLCVDQGKRLGLDVMQSMLNIVPIKGVPTLKGDLIRNLIKISGVCEKWEEYYEGVKGTDEYTHVLVFRRKGDKEDKRVTVSIADARRWGLFVDEAMVQKNKADIKAWWAENDPSKKSRYAPGDLTKSGWYRDPERMLMYRNIGFVGRDYFGDVINNMRSYEEEKDFQESLDLDNSTQERPTVEKGTTAMAATPRKRNIQKTEQKTEQPVPVAEPVVEAEYEEVPEPQEEQGEVEQGEVPVAEAPVPVEPVEELQQQKEEDRGSEAINGALLENIKSMLPSASGRPLHETSAFRAQLVKIYPQFFPDIKSVKSRFEELGVPNSSEFLRDSSHEDITLVLQKILATK